MLKHYIAELSDAFTREALHSPALLEDMASMERYLSESYTERAFIELLQNADDAQSRRVIIEWSNGDLIVANDGRPFSKSDILAISRSGASTKKRGESIGYRGIGFKSTTCFSDLIIISSNNCIFSFSKKLTSDRIGVPVDKVPTVRIPMSVSKESLSGSTRERIDVLHTQGFITVFVFCNANLEKCRSELHGLSMGAMLFLNNIVQLDIDPYLYDFTLEIIRTQHENDCEVKIFDKAKNYMRKWLVKFSNGIALAYQEDASDSFYEDVFHCFLPTLDTTGFGFRINGDFTTDPSRKHMVMDTQTKVELAKIGQYIAHLFIESIDSPSVFTCHIVSGYADQSSTNQFSATLDLAVKEELQKHKWINSITGVKLRPDECFLIPQWYTNATDEIFQEFISAEMCEYLVGTTDLSLRKALLKLGIKTAAPDIFNGFLLNKEAVSKLPEMMVNAIVSDLIRDYRMKDSQFTTIASKNWYVKINGESYSFNSVKENALLSEQFYTGLMSQSGNKSDINWFFETSQIPITSLSSSNLKNVEVRKFKPLHSESISRWRTAEEICMEIEENRGNRVTDVSKQNLGYDILSEEPSGSKRYLEVKSVKRIGDAITITNNEYTTANQYGNQYSICIISQQRNATHVVYVKNPLKNSRLEKRVKVWEWSLDHYSGEQFTL